MLTKRINFKLLREVGEAQGIPKFWGVYRHDVIALCVYVAPIPLNILFAAFLKVLQTIRFPMWLIIRTNTNAAYEKGFKAGHEKGSRIKIFELENEHYQQGWNDGYNYVHGSSRELPTNKL